MGLSGKLVKKSLESYELIGWWGAGNHACSAGLSVGRKTGSGAAQNKDRLELYVTSMLASHCI